MQLPTGTIMVVAGTRPEIIKTAPIIRALQRGKIPSIFVQCGQHYDYNMSQQQLIEELGVPSPVMATRSRHIRKELKPHT